MSSLAPAGALGAWVLAARPATLLVAIAPVLVGAALASAHAEVRAPAVGAALLGAVLILIGTNFANDVFDHEKGADDGARIGPQRAVASGLLSARAMKLGMWVVFLLSLIPGAYLARERGASMIAIGLVSIASGIAYTGGPFPLGYNGLGDVFVFSFFGLVGVPATAFVAIGSIPPAAWLLAVIVGALATNVLVVNNVRDHEGDRRAGKRTLVVRFGRAFGVGQYLASLVVSALCVVALWLLGWAPALALLSLVPLGLGLRLFSVLSRSKDGPTLNRCLKRTAMLLMAECVLLAASFALGSSAS